MHQLPYYHQRGHSELRSGFVLVLWYYVLWYYNEESVDTCGKFKRTLNSRSNREGLHTYPSVGLLIRAR